MHPLSDETLTGHLAGSLAPADARNADAHLQACPDCAKRLSDLAAWRQALSSFHPGPAGSLTAHRMEEALPKPRRLPLAAAAGLLLAVSLGVWLQRRLEPSRPSRTPAASPIPAGHRVIAANGAEILLSPDGAMQPGERWTLTQGACLATGRLDLSAGPLTLHLSEGEALVRFLAPASPLSWMRDAHASESARIEILILSGRAEALVNGERLLLAAGDSLTCEGSRCERKAVAEADRSRALEDFLGDGSPESGKGWILDGREGMASKVVQPPASSYSARVRLKVSESPSVLGLVFQVDGRTSLWAPEPASLGDGRWHVMQALITPGWVTLVVDGAVRHRLPREGFKPNPVAEVSGAGVVVWGGRLEISGFDVRALDAAP